jgi:hypothetical protein
VLQFLEEMNKKNDVVRYKVDKKVNTGDRTCVRWVTLLLQLSMGAGNMENAHMRSEMQHYRWLPIFIVVEDVISEYKITLFAKQ